MKLALVLIVVVAACGPTLRPLPPALPRLDELPPLEVEQVSVVPAPNGMPSAADQPRVTLNASRADVRVLIPALAQIAGVSVVMDESVRGTVAVRFENVPAIDALRTVIESAGLGIVGGPAGTWAESVFQQFPVNINAANADVISARFGVSTKLAEWIVLSRADR